MANSFYEVANFFLGLFSCLPRPFYALIIVFFVFQIVLATIKAVFQG